MHPFSAFPYRLEYKDGTDTRVCHFECEEHRDKHINDTNSEKEVTSSTTLPKDPIIPSLMFLE